MEGTHKIRGKEKITKELKRGQENHNQNRWRFAADWQGAAELAAVLKPITGGVDWL